MTFEIHDQLTTKEKTFLLFLLIDKNHSSGVLGCWDTGHK